MKRREFIQALGLSSLYYSYPHLGNPGQDKTSTGKNRGTGFLFKEKFNSGYELIPGTIWVDGLERTYWYALSTDPTENQFDMLVLCLHGSGANGLGFVGGPLQWRELSQNYRTLFVFPDGTGIPEINDLLPPQQRAFYWNVGYCCLSSAPVVENGVIVSPGVNDTPFLAALINQLLTDFNIPCYRVCIMGHSNGGMMAQKCAVEAPLFDVNIAAIASVSGPGGGQVPNTNPPVFVKHDPNVTLGNSGKKISAFLIHGLYDICTPYYGGTGLCGNYISFLETTEPWKIYNDVELLNTAETVDYIEQRYMERLPEGMDISLLNRAEVILMTYRAGHEWPDYLDITRRIMDFFQRVTFTECPWMLE